MPETCRITLTTPVRFGGKVGSVVPKCGLPVVAYGLCFKHYRDRLRLGGAA
jgi:hypothetical protein